MDVYTIFFKLYIGPNIYWSWLFSSLSVILFMWIYILNPYKGVDIV